MDARHFIKLQINRILSKTGYQLELMKNQANNLYPPDFEENEINVLKAVTPYTLTSPERIVSLIRAIRYITEFPRGLRPRRFGT